MRVSLPYYHVTASRAGRTYEVYIEAYLSEVAEDRLLCLLAYRKPRLLEAEPRGVAAEPWGSPDDVLRRYVDAAARLAARRSSGSARGGWALRRAVQEINRLFFGGFVVGPPAGPEVDRGEVSLRLAARLCRDVLGWALPGGYTVSGGKLLWMNVKVERRPEGGLRVLAGGGEDRILTYVVSESAGAARKLARLAGDV